MREIGPDAGGDRAQAGQAAVLGIIGADVDSDQVHLAAMGVQEGDRGGQLRPFRVAADPAVDHGGGRLVLAAELHQLQRRLAGAQHRVQLIRVALPGPDAGPRRVRLDPLGQRVAQGQVIGGRGLLEVYRCGGPGACGDRRHDSSDGDGERDADRTHVSFFPNSTIGRPGPWSTSALRLPSAPWHRCHRAFPQLSVDVRNGLPGRWQADQADISTCTTRGMAALLSNPPTTAYKTQTQNLDRLEKRHQYAIMFVRGISDLSFCATSTTASCPAPLRTRPMNTMSTASPDRDLLSRHQVAVMFRVTSALVAQW